MKKLVFLATLLISGLCWAEDVRDYTAEIPNGEWHPDVDDIVTALDYLKHDAWRSQALRSFREYRFQYFGKMKNNNKIVVLNAFCTDYWESAKDWRKTLVVIMDGGSCIFQAEFSVTDSRIISLRVNGEA